ncbi:MAG: hypothetical protein EOP48_24195 [Sphingobacteriales bacterium]|nr:MAG: hypothetical protein EOP48_24195 [Sphingobacteriales bacterium]
MTKQVWFVVISFVLVIIAGIICFKSFKNLKKSLYWLLFPDMVSIWSKKLWDEDFKNTFRFEVFALLAAALVGVNYLIFKFIL